MKLFSALVLGASVAVSATFAQADSTDYVLNTASTGGTYHPVGTAISTLSKVKLLPKQKFSLTAVNSAGSGCKCAGPGCRHCRLLQFFRACLALMLPPARVRYPRRKKTCVR